MNRAGIYIITSTENSRVYIGSTVNFKNRWKHHRVSLRRGVHSNPHLQRAWNKYGEDTFEFGVLEYLDDPEELHLAEQFWMDVYQEEGKKLYNFGLAARSARLGRPHSEETKRRIGKAHTGQTHTEETRRKLSEIAKARPPISDETRRRLSKQGREHNRWGKHHTEATKRKIGKANKSNQYALGHTVSEEARCKMGRAKAKPYPAFFHKGTGEIIPAGVNLRALCREYGLHQGHMWAVTAGRAHSHKGWVLLALS